MISKLEQDGALCVFRKLDSICGIPAMYLLNIEVRNIPDGLFMQQTRLQHMPLCKQHYALCSLPESRYSMKNA